MKMILLSLLILALLGCASTPPAPLIVQAPINDISLSEISQSPSRFIGSPVRWGGRILKSDEIEKETIAKNSDKTDKAEDGSRLKVEILAYPLDQEGKPVQTAEALGRRFIAILAKPYNAGRYYRNRWVTIAGDMTGIEEYTLANGEAQVLPVIEAEAKYAWRQEYRDDFYDDYWWPRFYLRYGFGHRNGRSGVGIIFSPLRFP